MKRPPPIIELESCYGGSITGSRVRGARLADVTNCEKTHIKDTEAIDAPPPVLSIVGSRDTVIEDFRGVMHGDASKLEATSRPSAREEQPREERKLRGYVAGWRPKPAFNPRNTPFGRYLARTVSRTLLGGRDDI